MQYLQSLTNCLCCCNFFRACLRRPNPHALSQEEVIPLFANRHSNSKKDDHRFSTKTQSTDGRRQIIERYIQLVEGKEFSALEHDLKEANYLPSLSLSEWNTILSCIPTRHVEDRMRVAGILLPCVYTSVAVTEFQRADVFPGASPSEEDYFNSIFTFICTCRERFCQMLLDHVNELSFTSDKMEFLKQSIEDTTLLDEVVSNVVSDDLPDDFQSSLLPLITCEQFLSILSTFPFSGDKMEIVKLMSKNIVDLPVFWQTIADEFLFHEDHQRCSNILLEFLEDASLCG